MGKDVRNRQAEAEEAWHAAQRYAYHLAHGGRPTTIVPDGAILRAREQAAFETAAEQARFYGDNGT